MAWKPKLPVVGTEVVPIERRPWVAVAEKNAELAVNLFVNVMKNPRLSMKLRMEAATRIVMIAGATFRGERKDAQGRPAANLPTGVQMQPRLSPDALRAALAQLPPGSVALDPEETVEGETYVVLHDGAHSRKPTGNMASATIGGLIEGQTPKEEAEALVRMRLEADAKRKEEEAKAREIPPNADPLEVLKGLAKKVKNKATIPDNEIPKSLEPKPAWREPTSQDEHEPRTS